MRARPLILITNDDGILADGINILATALQSVGDVVVCAPARQQSAVSHSISMHQPLRVRTLSPGRYAVAGTPADAIFVALAEICPRPPDLVVSGINHGSNLGTDVFYSGTIAGALEAALRGIPAVALSQQLPTIGQVPPLESEESQKANAWDPLDHLSPALDDLLQHSAAFATQMVRTMLEAPPPPGIALNVNAPNRATDAFCWTRLGKRAYRSSVIRRVDPRGIPYYWIGNTAASELIDEPGTDSYVVEAGMFSITPLLADWNTVLEAPLTWDLKGFSELSVRNTGDPT